MDIIEKTMNLIQNLYLFTNSDESKFNSRDLHIKPFFETAIQLLSDFDYKEDRIRYISGNFGCRTSDKEELVKFLVEKENTTSSDSYKILGFRSIWVMLNDNLEKIDALYMDSVNRKLSAFFL